jgi:hypothetical protein
MSFTILLRRDVFVDPRRFVDVVAPAIGATKLEAKMVIRKGRGIFLENLEEEPAKRIAAALAEAGLENFVVAREEIPTLPAPRKIVQVERTDAALNFRAGGGDALEALPWDAIHLASVGVVARPEYKDHYAHVRFDMIPAFRELGQEREIVRENLILKMQAAPRRDEAKPSDGRSAWERIDERHGTKVRVYCDLVTEGLGQWLRASMDDLAYAYPAQSVKLGGCWAIEKLFEDVKRQRLEALSEMTLKILDAGDISELVFTQVEEFNRYTSWAAILRHVRPEEKIPWAELDTSSPSPEPPGPSTDDGSSKSSPPEDTRSTSS